MWNFAIHWEIQFLYALKIAMQCWSAHILGNCVIASVNLTILLFKRFHAEQLTATEGWSWSTQKCPLNHFSYSFVLWLGLIQHRSHFTCLILHPKCQFSIKFISPLQFRFSLRVWKERVSDSLIVTWRNEQVAREIYKFISLLFKSSLNAA